MTETMHDPTPPKRRPGAAKGNRNAFKHGRYSAEVLDLRRRLRAWHRRANAAIAAANRLARAKNEAEREKARAEIHVAVRAEGGKPKTVKQLSFGSGAAGGGGDPENRPKTAEQLSFACADAPSA